MGCTTLWTIFDTVKKRRKAGSSVVKLKNLMAELVLLLLLAAMLTGLAPVGADAAALGQIDSVDIALSIPPVVSGEVAAMSATLKSRGCYIAGVGWYDMYGQTMTGKFTYDTATLVVTVNASPGCYFSGAVAARISGEYAPCENYGSQLVISKSFSPVVWAPSISKHPLSETIFEGGLVSFVSYAAFADECSWTIIDTEGKHYSIDALAQKFPQLQFYTEYGKLNMGPIPKAMNGYKVRCSFTGPGGMVNSGYADIIIETPENMQGVPQAQLPQPVAHDHVFSTKLTSDAGYHWYGCSCGETKDKGVHRFEWIQKREASEDMPGFVQGVCSVCGYTLNARTKVDPEAVEKAPAATPAPTSAPTAAPTPVPTEPLVTEEEQKIMDRLERIFGFLKKDKPKFTDD